MMELSFDGRDRDFKKKKNRDQDPRLKNIFEPEQRRRTAEKFGRARVTILTNIDPLQPL